MCNMIDQKEPLPLRHVDRIEHISRNMYDPTIKMQGNCSPLQNGPNSLKSQSKESRSKYGGKLLSLTSKTDFIHYLKPNSSSYTCNSLSIDKEKTNSMQKLSYNIYLYLVKSRNFSLICEAVDSGSLSFIQEL